MSLAITPKNIAAAEAFLQDKWIELFRDTHHSLAHQNPDAIPTDLAGSGVYAALFAQAIFGGDLRGNAKHIYVVNDGKRIDLTGANMHRHAAKIDSITEMNIEACRERAVAWAGEFLGKRSLSEDFRDDPKDFGYRTDNPGEDYCQRKQAQALIYQKEARGQGLHGKLAGGPVTAHMGIMKPMYIAAKVLKHLDGANDEHFFRHPGDVKYDSLAARVRANGWNQEHAVMIRVGHTGNAVIMEGNTRVAIANAFGVRDVKVQFEWVNGAENCPDDLWSPKRVAELCVKTPEPNLPLNEDAEDHFKPIPMTEPKVLYRSVSLPELSDIRMRNRVMGGGSRFNDFEHRRYVFFGDKLNDTLIYQGEEIERQAQHGLTRHAIHRQFKNIIETVAEEAEMVLSLLKQAGIKLPEERYQDHFRQGNNIRSFRNLASQIRDDGQRHRITNFLRKIEERMAETTELQQRYRHLLSAHQDIVRQRVEPSAVSSAILVTKPITGGLHYSKRHGSSGMGDDDEYGFQPGELTLEDIDKILLVKSGKIIGELTVSELETQLPDLEERWASGSV